MILKRKSDSTHWNEGLGSVWENAAPAETVAVI